MKTFEISLTQFSNYLTKIGHEKVTVAKQIHREMSDEYLNKQDYWSTLKNKIRIALSRKKNSSFFDSLPTDVTEQKKLNYEIAVNGLKKFWKNMIFETFKCSSSWRHGKVSINVKPEICGTYKNKHYIIKLYTHVKEPIKRSTVELMLQIMHASLKIDFYDDIVIIGVLDVGTGILHKYKDKDDSELTTALLQSEAEMLGKLLEKLSV